MAEQSEPSQPEPVYTPLLKMLSFSSPSTEVSSAPLVFFFLHVFVI
jgi:hypothetical protein